MYAIVAAALFSGALAFNATTTVEDVKYTTIECSTPTTFAYGNSTYTVTEATTLTVKDCSCTSGPTSVGASNGTAPASSAPALANGASVVGAGAAVGVAAAVAYLL